MKQRVLSSVVGILLLIVVLIFYNTPVLTAALALLSALAVYELLVPTRFVPPKPGLLCALFGGAGIFLMKLGESIYFHAFALFLAVLIGCALFFHRSFSFRQLSVCAFAAALIPLAFSTILKMDEIIYLILTCVAAWVTDMGAFFIGRAFGKRKLAPQISPHKTVAGAVGGLVCTGIVFPLVCFGYAKATGASFAPFNAVLVGCVCALLGMLGDLFASVIKREAGIKDFGKIMPGHGGVLDRFDSFLFAAPALYELIRLFPIFTR